MELYEGDHASVLKSFAPKAEAGPSQGKSFKWMACRYYKEGMPSSCRQGAACTFAHGQAELVPKPDHMTSVDGEPRGLKRNAKAANLPGLCMHHLRGKCDKGDDCVFFHDEESFKKATPPSYKTNLCDNYMGTGNCKRGQACCFAHGRYELRPFDYKGDFDQKIKDMPNWKTNMCQFFIKTGGNCRNGAECDYAHGDKELRTIKQTAFDNLAVNGMVKPGVNLPICKFFSQGNCTNGLKCKFSHGQAVASPAATMYDYTSDVTPATMAATAAPHPVAAMMNNKDALYSEFMEFLDQKFQGASPYGMKPQQMMPTGAQFMPRPRAGILGAGAQPQSMMTSMKYSGVSHARAPMTPAAAAQAAAAKGSGMTRGMTFQGSFQDSSQYASPQDQYYEDYTQ